MCWAFVPNLTDLWENCQTNLWTKGTETTDEGRGCLWSNIELCMTNLSGQKWSQRFCEYGSVNRTLLCLPEQTKDTALLPIPASIVQIVIFFHRIVLWKPTCFSEVRVFIIIDANHYPRLWKFKVCRQVKLTSKRLSSSHSLQHGCHYSSISSTINAVNCTTTYLMNQIGNCLIQLAISYHKDFHFKFQNWSWDAKVIREQSELSQSL